MKMMKTMTAIAFCAVGCCAGLSSMAAESPKENVLFRLKEVANSPNYYWAWTGPWLDHGWADGDTRHVVEADGAFRPKPLADVKLACSYQKYADGRRAVINYADLASLVGTWHSPRYYAVNRAGLTAAVKKQWAEFGGVMVFSWHLDHPYCTNGFRAASYRFKSAGANRNVVRQILDDTGDPCGTGSIDGKKHRAPFKNPREWYLASLKDIADFFNGLVDESGKKIPVILRYPHECDGSWFWWGRTWCTAEEFRRLCRMEADYLRKACGDDQILFAYTPDRTWKEFGKEGDSENTFLAYYPGDKYVDIVGVDDYSIGNGKTKEEAERSLEKAIGRLREISSFAAKRGLVASISEAGGKGKRDDFWQYLHRAATADGVKVAFVDTWSGVYGTTPETPASEEDERAFARRPQVLMEGSRNASFRKAAKTVFTVSADRPDCRYEVGARVVYTVTATDEQGAPLKDGKVTWSLDNFGSDVIAPKTEVDLAAGNPFRVEGSLPYPGFLRLNLKAADGSSRVWSVAVAPERVHASSPRPADFDTFWDDAMAKLEREVPLDPQIELVAEKSKGAFDYYDVSFATFGGRVYGFFTVPKDRSKKYPALMTVPGAGPYHNGSWYGSGNRVSLMVNVLPFKPDRDNKKFTADYEAWEKAVTAKFGVHGRYGTAGIAVSREAYVYYSILLGINRAVNWLAERPEVDRSRICYYGGSQGGAFGYFLLGLNKNFARGAMYVPAMADHLAWRQKRQPTWPSLLDAQPAAGRATAEKNAPYFDIAHFAPRIRVPVRSAVGLSDTTCPPAGGWSAFNALGSRDKKMTTVPGMTHKVDSKLERELFLWACGL